MKVRRKIDACFEGVLRVFQGCFKGVSRVFQGVSKKFNVAWHSSQLPEQKEGLFLQLVFENKMRLFVVLIHWPG